MTDIRDHFGQFNLCLLPVAAGSLSSRLHIPEGLTRHLHALPIDAVDMSNLLTARSSTSQAGHVDGERPLAERCISIGIHHTAFDSKTGAERTMREVSAARGKCNLGSEWKDGGFVMLQPGSWVNMSNL